jgi:hypothetical protein
MTYDDLHSGGLRYYVLMLRTLWGDPRVRRAKADMQDSLLVAGGGLLGMARELN